ncbi:MAG: carbon storage regulator [Peptostreptococcaceae bacterium]|jgi:global regulator protein family|nr:carbon storage regulator [Peptostreptococcaceae bacterium]
MLVLKRKLNEAILITTQSGEKIEIKVSDISEGRVKLGIDAAKSISVLRKEVVDAATDENRESTKASSVDKNKLKDIFNKK